MTKDFEVCRDIGEGVHLCKERGSASVSDPDRSVVEEFSRALIISTRPYMTKDEASYIEDNFSTIFFGTILSALGFVLGFYIYYLIGELQIPTINGNPIFTAFIVIGVIVMLILLISFVQYRVTKALRSTNIVEKFARDEDLSEIDLST